LSADSRLHTDRPRAPTSNTCHGAATFSIDAPDRRLQCTLSQINHVGEFQASEMDLSDPSYYVMPLGLLAAIGSDPLSSVS
jgi:hypothetical protein